MGADDNVSRPACTPASPPICYELTMAAGYWSAGMTEPATFELFVRRLPPSRGYLLVAGLEQALDYLEAVRFAAEDRAWLQGQPQFARIDARFFDDYLARFRFTGDVWSVREGTAVFANEPIVRVTAPLPEAQIVETALLSSVLFPTSVATKAARLVTAAGGRPIVDFGVRRAHGLSAGLAAARAAYTAGCAATSFVEASRRYGIPASGTMAHSWVQSFTDEAEAFRTFERMFGRASVYLLDTYDTLGGVRHLIRCAPRSGDGAPRQRRSPRAQPRRAADARPRRSDRHEDFRDERPRRAAHRRPGARRRAD